MDENRVPERGLDDPNEERVVKEIRQRAKVSESAKAGATKRYSDKPKK